MKILFLTARMCLGYGVDVVIWQLSLALQKQNVAVLIGCNENDGFYSGENVIKVAPHVSAISWLIRCTAPDLVIIHSEPFFDRLAHLKKLHPQVKWMLWEHGDPFPRLFKRGREFRESAILRKQTTCYPNADHIVAISEFIDREIGSVNGAVGRSVVYNGCDHTPDLGPKTDRDQLNPGRPLRVGTLCRIGEGEANYKGADLFVKIVNGLTARGMPLTPAFMGKGTIEAAAELRAAGFDVVLNAPDAEKWEYLRGLDIFVSCSQWEGFNLPLVEAQASGTLSLALGLCAHPEVCPFTFSSPEKLEEAIYGYHLDRAKLQDDSENARRFVRGKFSWASAGDKLMQLACQLLNAGPKPETTHLRLSRVASIGLLMGRCRHYIRYRLLGF